MAAPTKKAVRESALAYFDALARRDADAMAACWAPGGLDDFVGQQVLVAPDGVRDYFTALFAAFPDLEAEVLHATTDGRRCAVQWRIRGTFAGPGSFQGFEPTGARIEIRGCDVVEVDDEGRITANTAFMDGADVARQLGALPPRESKAEQRMAALFNRRTRLARRLGPSAPEPVADGVWRVRGGLPRTMNVYLLADDGGVTMFDAGIAAMTHGLGQAAAELGGLKRVVLGHAHADHRGAAPGLRAPVYCHPADRDDAEGDGGAHYMDMSKLDRFPGKFVLPPMLGVWDGGPVQISGTVSEGDEIAGFRVVHLPGHAPGLIGLYRESDRLALTSDCFYTLDPQTGRPGHARVPHAAFNQDTEQARASIRKLAEMEPAAAWPGHAEPLTGDVRGALERAAATT